ncbi:leucine-rich repeat domain-containing protein, partial [Legionella septentrionalis]
MYPASFYYLQTGGLSYSHTPQGELNVERLLQQKAYWQMANAGSLEKKTIILADWSFNTASIWKQWQVQQKLAQLAADGFNVYISVENEMLPLEEFIFQEDQPKIIPQFPQDIKKSAYKHLGVLPEQVHILDDHTLTELIDPRRFNPNEREISVGSVKYLSKELKTRLIKILKVAKPALTRVIDDQFILCRDHTRRLAAESNFFSVPGLEKYKSALVSYEGAVKKTFEEYIKQLSDLTGIEAFDFVDISESNLGSILQRSTNVKHLNLQTTPISRVDYLPESLESFECFNISMQASLLEKLFAKLPQCTAYILEDLKIEEEFAAEVKLPHVTLFKFNNCQLSGSVFENLLAAAPNLKSLSLHGFQQIKLTKGFNLSHLEEFNSNDAALLPLLSHPEHLKRLKLSKIPSAKLKHLQSFLSKAYGLVSLEVNAPFEITEPLSLPHLVEFSNNNPNLSAQTLRHLLHASHKLKRLELPSFIEPLGELLDAIPCKNLTALTIDGYSVTAASLAQLREKAPKLASLKLWNCPRLLNLKPVDLSSLTELELDASRLSVDDFLTLLNSAPNLQVLDFGNKREVIKHLLKDPRVQERLRRIPDFYPGIKAPKLKSPAVSQSSFAALASLAQMDGEMPGNPLGFAFPSSGLQASLGQGKALVDANTVYNEGKQFSVTRVFYPLSELPESPPEVSGYRLSMYDEVRLNPEPCEASAAFSLVNGGSLQLTPCSVGRVADAESSGRALHAKRRSYKHYRGTQMLAAGDDWQALASLDAREVLAHYQADAEVEFQYAKRDNQYYARHRSGKALALHYVVEVPQKEAVLPREIKELVQEFQGFGRKGLEFKSGVGKLRGEEYAQAIYAQKTGACRHRAIAFKHEMARRYPKTPVRVVNNECHSFVEVKVGINWIACDLGGYPAKLAVTNPVPPVKRPAEVPASVLPQSEEVLPQSQEVLPQSQEILPPSSVVIEELPEIPSNPNSYYGRFETWVKEKPRVESLLSYSQRLLQPLQGKRLIDLGSEASVLALQSALLLHAKRIHRPVYVINSPDDLICSAPYVARQGERGDLKRGPGGPLHDFLQKPYEEGNPPILLVNYDAFRPEDFVRLNGLIDAKPHADGTPLPAGAMVIGLINTSKPDCYQGEDFYSRFGKDAIEVCPLDEATLLASQRALPFREASEALPGVAIDLYHGSDWKERLIGRWVLQGDSLFFKKGELVTALESGVSVVEIGNGLWEDKDFLQFWQQALIRGGVDCAGEVVSLPEDFALIKKEGYAWADWLSLVEFKHGLAGVHPSLNPTLFSQCFTRYRCDAQTQTLETLVGLVEQHQKEH